MIFAAFPTYRLAFAIVDGPPHRDVVGRAGALPRSDGGA
jgi:hypothetical protein